MCPDRATAEDIMGENVKILDSIHEPDQYDIDDSMILPPLSPEEAAKVEIVRGPNIKFLPVPEPPQETLVAPISLKARDNVSTDDITPASAEFSSMRSNIPLMSQYCYHRYDPEFAARAKEMGQSVIIGGENYGQGSSREHAAINPMYLGVKAVIAKSIARIHKGNLVNHGVIPMLFEDGADYDRLEQTDELHIDNLREQIAARRVQITDKTKGFSNKAKYNIPDGYITIEFTESFSFNNLDVLSNIVTELKKNGFRCSIDDFGSGYSSCGVLKELPVDELKLDMFLLKPSAHPQKDEALLESMIRLGKAFDMKVTQEGVETMEQFEMLKRMGCDVIQGYLYSKPLLADDFQAFVQSPTDLQSVLKRDSEASYKRPEYIDFSVH